MEVNSYYSSENMNNSPVITIPQTQIKMQVGKIFNGFKVKSCKVVEKEDGLIEYDQASCQQKPVADTLNFDTKDEFVPKYSDTDTMFGLQIEGALPIKTAGEYYFIFQVDDGIRVYLNDETKPVIDHWKIHSKTVTDVLKGPYVKYYVTDMVEGVHKIRIEYFQYQSKATLQFVYKGPDTNEKFNLVKGFHLKPIQKDNQGNFEPVQQKKQEPKLVDNWMATWYDLGKDENNQRTPEKIDLNSMKALSTNMVESLQFLSHDNFV